MSIEQEGRALRTPAAGRLGAVWPADAKLAHHRTWPRCRRPWR